MGEKLIEFLRKKDFRLLKEIGQGGTGRTVLLDDETINEKFICKKYSPLYEEYKETYYSNFVREIKLLHLLYHKNVVRVFNYYLYPEKTTGYILMEFVDGLNIADYIGANPERINDIFTQTISGFRHLEENEILHRDIRPENILVSGSGIVKIIDFGFGKKVTFDVESDNSISINWRYSIPKDFETKTYNFRTEVYFIGKLFEEIIKENDIQNFAHSLVLNQMISFDQDKRIACFFDVDRKIIEGDSVGINFSFLDKKIYQEFAFEIKDLFSSIEDSAEYVKDINLIISSLEESYRNSMLEIFVQNPVSIARCFVRGQYYYKKRNDIIKVSTLKDFLSLLNAASLDKKRIIINNLWQRLDGVDRYSVPSEDDLPF